jgi:hypothetical protein
MENRNGRKSAVSVIQARTITCKEEEEDMEEEEDKVGRTTKAAYAENATGTSPTSQRTITSADHATVGLKKEGGDARSENMLTWTNRLIIFGDD